MPWDRAHARGGAMIGEGEAALARSGRRSRTRGSGALDRRLAGTRQIVGQIDDKDFGMRRT